MMMYRKIILLLLTIGAFTAQSFCMEPNIPEQQAPVDQQTAPFFNVVPTLKQSAEIYLIKSMLANHELIEVFQGTNVPIELKDITALAKILSCLIEITQDDELKDFDVLDLSFDRETEKSLAEDGKFNVLKLMQCVRREAIIIFKNEKLANLWLLLLNDPAIQAQFPFGKKQVNELLSTSILRLFMRGQISTLEGWLVNYFPIREIILTQLISLLNKTPDDVINLYFRFNLLQKPSENPDLPIEYDLAPIINNEATKNEILKATLANITYLFSRIPKEDITQHSDMINQLITGLYRSNNYYAAQPLLKILFLKGANPNVVVHNLAPAIYFFGVRGNNLLINAPEREKMIHKKFIVLLVENGLDIHELQLQPVAPQPGELVNQTPLAIAQRNYQLAIKEDPVFKTAIENAQREYQQKKARETTRKK